MAYGIGSILGDVDQKADTFRDNPDALAQMYQQNQQLVDLLALQKIKSDKEAAMRDMQMKMQAPAATIKDQREQEVMDMTRAEVAEQMAPGLQMLAQQQQNAQQQPQGQPPSGMEGGLPSLPAPNMQGVGMADGGIVGYQQGGGVAETPFGRGLGKYMEESRRSEDKEQAEIELRKPYQKQAGVAGYFMPQTEEERAFAQKVMQDMPTLSYADKLALLATGEIPEAVEEPSDNNEDAASKYLELMRNPPTSAVIAEDANTFVEETPPAAENMLRVNQRTTAEQPPAPNAPLASTKLNDEDFQTALASMLGEDVAPQPAAPQTAAPQDTGISRYEQQYDNLLTQQEDKLDKLITFLLSAGASRGTNLGATLTGGGVGLQNRDARIKAEIDDTIKNIEALKLDREKMQMDQSRFESDLALRRDVAEANKSQAQADSAQRMALAKMEITSAEDLAEFNNKAAQIIRDSANQDTITRGQNDNNRAMFNAAQKAAIELRKQLLDGNFDDDGKTKLELELELAKTNEHLIKLQTQLERFSGDNVDYNSLKD